MFVLMVCNKLDAFLTCATASDVCAEAFVVCQKYSPPEGFSAEDLQQYLQAASATAAMADPRMRESVPFVACGDLSGWDADQSYSLPLDYVALPPIQPPTAPAYADALATARSEVQSGRRRPTPKRPPDVA